MYIPFCHPLECSLFLQIWNKNLSCLQWKWMLENFIGWKKQIKKKEIDIMLIRLKIYKFVYMKLYKASQNQVALYIEIHVTVLCFRLKLFSFVYGVWFVQVLKRYTLCCFNFIKSQTLWLQSNLKLCEKILKHQPNRS